MFKSQQLIPFIVQINMTQSYLHQGGPWTSILWTAYDRSFRKSYPFLRVFRLYVSVHPLSSLHTKISSIPLSSTVVAMSLESSSDRKWDIDALYGHFRYFESLYFMILGRNGHKFHQPLISVQKSLSKLSPIFF